MQKLNKLCDKNECTALVESFDMIYGEGAGGD